MNCKEIFICFCFVALIKNFKFAFSRKWDNGHNKRNRRKYFL